MRWVGGNPFNHLYAALFDSLAVMYIETTKTNRLRHFSVIVRATSHKLSLALRRW